MLRLQTQLKKCQKNLTSTEKKVKTSQQQAKGNKIYFLKTETKIAGWSQGTQPKNFDVYGLC